MKKLIPAMCMLLIAASLFGTSTFAWFSMNRTVTATGMSVTAISDAAALVINTGDAFNPESTDYTVNATTASVKLLPVEHGTVANAGEATAVGSITAITNKADMADASKWWHAYSSANNTSAATVGTAAVVANGQLNKYLHKETFYVGLNEMADDATQGTNLYVSAVTVTADKGVKVVVVCGDNVRQYVSGASTSTADTLAAVVTKEGVQVDVYYYISGEDTKVYTDNIANLTGSIELKFSVQDVVRA